MSSPIQPPPNIRRPASTTSLSQPPISSSGPAASPYAPQLPPPPLISPGGPPRPPSATTSRPLPPPPLTDLPYHSSPIASSSTLATSGPTYASIPQSPAQGLPSLPPPSSMTSPVKTHGSSIMSSAKSSLPPIPPRGGPPSSGPSPYTDSGAINTGRSGPSSPPPPPSAQPSTQNTRQPQTVPQNTSNNSSSNAGYRPLNVRDALTYLDQVKVQFSSQPDVYNRFLDIMKDFKSQSIDTPGVIERVSILFNGHPELISGFNTFLPPGYRIECSTDPNEPDVIRVTTPTGTTLTRTSRPVVGGGLARGAGQSYRDQENSNVLHGSSPMSALPPQPPPLPAHGAYYQSPYGQMPPPHPPSLGGPHPLQPPMSSHPLHPPAHNSYMSGSGSASTRRPPSLATHEQQEPIHSGQGSPNSRRAPVEFNHAINYVNKIKTRYANEPETYKQFLEILQTYQKERKPIQEVFAQVQYLFNGAPDLLYEFKQFLPEITGQSTSEFFDDMEPPYMGAGPKRGMYGGMSSSQYMPPGKKKRTVRAKGSKIGMDEDYIAGYPASSYFDPAKPSISTEEIELFEQIRKHIGNKPSYEEFLKILNLYTQQIIDADVLMKQVEGFLGSDRELFDWFKTVVAVDLKDHTIERPPVIIPKPDLNHCATVDSSPSYRLVSKEWQNQPCSARDQLCWEVLNDEYVSHPIWASEDSGFVASKKNQYEEAMHRTEEERYDYDLNIDANLNTIALLEPIAEKLKKMTPEEQENFRLEPGLGGQSVTIYERIIKKVYDEDRGKEIIELLYSNPAKVVPILLKRLIQKDEEWRKAQHEWNKTWREVDAKNFYRSLDYQGLTFKSNDRKAMAVKSLVSEIETLHEESHSEGNNGVHPEGLYPLLFSFDDATIFKDISRLIFSYIEKQNGFNSSDRGKIRTFIKIFIPLFFHVDDVIPEGAHIESDDGDEGSGEEDEDAGSINTEDSEVDSSRSPRDRSRSPTSSYSRRSGRNRNDDSDGLLRDVLKKQSRNSGDDNETVNSFDAGEKSPSVPRDASETPVPEDNAESNTQQDTEEGAQNTNTDEDNTNHYGNGTGDQPVKTEENSADERDAMLSGDAEVESNVTSHDSAERSQRSPSVKEEHGKKTQETDGDRLFAAAAAATAPDVQKRTTYSFFCNTAFYCFFRLYQLVYERLQKMKELDAKAKANPDGYKKINSVALELGLYTNRFDDIDLSNGSYQAILELIDRFFDGDIDQAMFEEKTRYVFATEAHVLFTIDKLMHSVVKQIQLLTSDEKTVELVDLFRGDLTLEATCPRTISVYRLRAEETLGSDENLYKVNFDTQTNRMTIQLVDKDDDMLESTPQDQYENYVASYMDWTKPTQGIDIKKMQPAFLRRTWKPHTAHLNNIFVQSKLQYKIQQDSYHMAYIIGSEDAFIRPPAGARKKDEMETTGESAEWRQWLESRSTGWSKGIESDEACKTREEEERKLLSE